MKNHLPKLFTALFLFISTGEIFCQITADILIASKHFRKGDSLMRTAQYPASVIEFIEASNFYQINEYWNDYFRCQNKIAECYWRLGQFDKAIELSNTIINQCEQKLGLENIQKAIALGNLGATMNRQGEYESALQFFKEQLDITQKISEAEEKIIPEIYQNIGNCYQHLGMVDVALQHFQHVEALYNEYEEFSHEKRGNLYYSIGRVYFELNRYEYSLKYFEKSRLAYQQNEGDNGPNIAAVFNSVGNIYKNQGYYKLALEYYDKALKLSSKFFGNNHPRVSITTGNIGLVNLLQGDHDLALKNHKGALKLQKDYFGKVHPIMAMSYNNIALTFSHMTSYDSALYYYQKALDVQYSTFGQGHPKNYLLYHNIGEMHHHNGNIVEAIKYYNKALSGTSENQISIKTLMALGTLYKEQNKYEESLYYFQLAIIDNVPTFQDSTFRSFKRLEDAIFPIYLFNSLQNIGEVYLLKHNRSGRFNDLEASLQNFELCDSLADHLRASALVYDDKLSFTKMSSKVFERAIEVCLKMYDHTQDIEFQKRAFYFAEKNKGSILSDRMVHSYAKNTGLLPENLRNLEDKLKSERDFYQSQLSLLKKELKTDSTKVDLYKNKLFRTNLQFDSLIVWLEENYPVYYKLKYSNDLLSVKSLQDKINSKTAVIEIFEGSDNIYIFVLSSEVFEIIIVDDKSLINLEVDKIRELIAGGQKVLGQDSSYTQFHRVGVALYQRLLQKALTRLSNEIEIKNLVIIPDGKLAHMPFELLLTSLNTKAAIGDYSSLNYLIKKYNISYSYSTTLRFSDKNLSMKESAPNGFIGFAPKYNFIRADSSSHLALGNYRDKITELHWNETEVKNIAGMVNGTYRSADLATETEFKEEAGKYNIIHLAMHALMDYETPMNSKLVFTKDEADTLNDGYLHVYELFNMELNPDLVVLSACNTGYGAHQEGEGMMSLAYAFAYSGCPNIIMSHWSVDDESTSILMQSFYKHLSSGLSKTEALRAAKLDFLKDPSNIYSNPSYWAGFVLMGDEVTKKDYHFYLILIASVIIIFILLSLFILIRWRRKISI